MPYLMGWWVVYLTCWPPLHCGQGTFHMPLNGSSLLAWNAVMKERIDERVAGVEALAQSQEECMVHALCRAISDPAPEVYGLLRTTYYLLLTHYLSFVTHYLLLTTHYLLRATRSPLAATCC